MTYICLIAGVILFPLLLIEHEAVLSIAVYFYGLVTGVIMAYFGSSHFDDKDKRAKNNEP
jgi:hypothetical protein